MLQCTGDTLTILKPSSATIALAEGTAVGDAFRIGDGVRLKSGGRHMTFVAIRETPDGDVSVEGVLFEIQAMGGEAKERDWFLPEALDKGEVETLLNRK